MMIMSDLKAVTAPAPPASEPYETHQTGQPPETPLIVTLLSQDVLSKETGLRGSWTGGGSLSGPPGDRCLSRGRVGRGVAGTRGPWVLLEPKPSLLCASGPECCSL